MASNKVFDADRYAKNLRKVVGQKHRKVTFAIFRGIIFRTPKDTGRAMASWMIQQDSPDNSIPSFDTKSKKSRGASAGDSLRRMSSVNVQPFSKTYLTNNLPYPIYLEKGSSEQRPDGFVKITIAEVKEKTGNIFEYGT
jgi:hypothetical protein